jgi:hypothetical protein
MGFWDIISLSFFITCNINLFFVTFQGKFRSLGV